MMAPLTGTETRPTCSVVVCTRNRPGLLARCLEAVARQDYPAFEILVVDNAPDGSDAQEVTRRSGARYAVEPLPGLSRARNHGARAAEGEIVAYVDDDAVPEPGWLAALAAEFDDPRVTAAAGRILPLVPDAAALPWAQTLDRGPARRTVERGEPNWFEIANFGGIGTGGNMAFRRTAFNGWRGFDERLGRGAPIAAAEEHHAFFKLLERGGRIVYAPAAVVRHPAPESLERLHARQLGDMAAAAAYMALLWVEEPRYRGRLIRYVGEWLQGAPRPWRGGLPDLRRARPPRWRCAVAAAGGMLGCAGTIWAAGLRIYMSPEIARAKASPSRSPTGIRPSS